MPDSDRPLDPEFVCPHCGAAFPDSLTAEAYERDALEHND